MLFFRPLFECQVPLDFVGLGLFATLVLFSNTILPDQETGDPTISVRWYQPQHQPPVHGFTAIYPPTGPGRSTVYDIRMDDLREVPPSWISRHRVDDPHTVLECRGHLPRRGHEYYYTLSPLDPSGNPFSGDFTLNTWFDMIKETNCGQRCVAFLMVCYSWGLQIAKQI